MNNQQKDVILHNLAQDLEELLSRRRPKDIQYSLRKIFFEYLKEVTANDPSPTFKNMVDDVDWLFNFLELAEDAYKSLNPESFEIYTTPDQTNHQ